MPTRTATLTRSSTSALFSRSKELVASIAASGLHWSDEIEVLDRLILEAKARRNLIIPIARMLPVEVLGEIFEHTISDFDSEKSNRNRAYNPWSAIMLVCRPWRDVAVNHPALWTNLVTRNAKLWPTFIARSRGHSIDVTLRTDNPFIGASLAAAFAQLHRVRSLEVRAPHTFLEKVLPMLNSYAPKLERLTLENRSGNWCHALEGDFVSEHTPNLRDLSLTGVCFPWGYRAPNLRTLSVSRHEHGSSPLPEVTYSVSAVLQSLSNTLLEEIRIADISSLPLAPAEDTIIPPAHLRVLELKKVPVELALPLWFSTSNVLSDLETTDISIVRPGTFSPSQLDMIVSHAAAHMANHPAYVKNLRIRIARGGFAIDSNILKFFMPHPPFTVSGATVVSALVAAISPERLTTLSLELKSSTEWPAATLESVLSRVTRIVDLKFSAAPDMLHLLSKLLGRHAIAGSTHPPLLPMLRMITLSHMDLTQQYQERPIYTFMSTMLHWRRLTTPNLGPFAVEIKRCWFTAAVVTSFAVGGQINVNHNEQPAGEWALGSEPWALGGMDHGTLGDMGPWAAALNDMQPEGADQWPGGQWIAAV
ncbi:hypothetical protein PENSPDRAFT_647756 [Peniophora sp. CONT]|nr:hypothetical protein PENSPDRAFT_647756 [Peniophora sp. CONT]